MPGAFAPIQETQVGAVAYLFGITTDNTPIVITGLASFELDSDDISLVWDEKDNKDTTGNTQNKTRTNYRYERTIKFIPSGATRAAAAQIADNQGSGILNLQNLVVTHYKVSVFNGTWLINSGIKVNLKMDDNATIDITCVKYVNNAQNAALTGAPIAG